MFKTKHPEYAQSFVLSKFEDFAWGEFDLIISLFGSLSYVNPLYLPRVKEMLRPHGRYFLMFPADDYEPISCVKNGITSSHFKGSWKGFNEPFTFNNFKISQETIH